MKRIFVVILLFCCCAVIASVTSSAQQTNEPQNQQTPAPTPSPSKPGDPTAETKVASPALQPSPAPPVAGDPVVLSNRGVANRRGAVALPPEKSNPMRVPRFDSAPVIDGRIDEAVWQSAAEFNDFYQTNPGDNTQPSRPTRVLVGYDDKHLYFAFDAKDEPDKIRATIAKRDNVFGEDNVRIFLDTFNDQRSAYVLGFNPLGIQADGILTEGRGTDFSVDIVMESKGVITSDGYVIEVAIPFKSLRYEAGKDKLWGIHIWRNIDRFNDEIDSWMPLSRDIVGQMNQAGHITGLEGISTTRQIEIIPSVTFSHSGRRARSFFVAQNGMFDAGRFANEGFDFDPGLTAKFGITPTITLDFAYNPDFAQVEADATVVTANQRFPIFFREKRPFFLERIDIFQTRMNAVNTRAIVDPDYAIKLTGRRGRNTFGLIAASDNAPGNYSEDERVQLRDCQRRRLVDPTVTCGSIERFLDKNSFVGVMRLKRDVGRDNSLGFVSTAYIFPERRNFLGGFDGRFRVDPKTIAEFQVLGTHSRRFFFDPDLVRSIYRNGNGFGYSYLYDYTGRTFGYVVNGVGRTRDYRADLGFTPRQNTNQHRAAVRFNTEPDSKRTVISRRLTSEAIFSHDWQGRSQQWNDNTQIQLQFQRQTVIGGGLQFGYERVLEEEFGGNRSATRRGAFAGEDSERSAYNRELYFFINSSPTQKFGGEVVVSFANGALDFDFGGGERFPRVSPSALSGALIDPDCRFDVNSRCPFDPGAGRALYIESSVYYQPTNKLNTSLDYTKSRLIRNDTDLVAFDDNIFTFRSTYQFTRNTFARARIDYSTLTTRFRPQFLLGWTPNPGTAVYVGYNDDLNRNGFNPFTGGFEPGLRRNTRTFFLKMSYLFRREI